MQDKRLKSRMLLGICSLFILLMAAGCSDALEEPPAADLPSPEYDTESENEILTGDGGEPVDAAEGGLEEQAESDLPVSGYDTESAYDTASGNEALPEDGSEPADVTEREQTELPDCYEELIAAARECIEGTVQEGQDYDFSEVILRYANLDNKEKWGYLIEDIDGDGTEELIFGQNDHPGSAWNGVVYDLYTICDGELVHVFDGQERNIYYLCENGMIANEGNSSAALSHSAYYVFEGSELHLVEAVRYNGWDYPDHPWSYSTQSADYYDMENAEFINEEQAWAVMGQYVYRQPVFTPFVEESLPEHRGR